MPPTRALRKRKGSETNDENIVQNNASTSSSTPPKKQKSTAQISSLGAFMTMGAPKPTRKRDTKASPSPDVQKTAPQKEQKKKKKNTQKRTRNRNNKRAQDEDVVDQAMEEEEQVQSSPKAAKVPTVAPSHVPTANPPPEFVTQILQGLDATSKLQTQLQQKDELYKDLMKKYKELRAEKQTEVAAIIDQLKTGGVVPVGTEQAESEAMKQQVARLEQDNDMLKNESSGLYLKVKNLEKRMKNAYSRIEELKEQLEVKESSAAEAQEKLAQLELELEEQQTYVDTYKLLTATRLTMTDTGKVKAKCVNPAKSRVMEFTLNTKSDPLEYEPGRQQTPGVSAPSYLTENIKFPTESAPMFFRAVMACTYSKPGDK